MGRTSWGSEGQKKGGLAGHLVLEQASSHRTLDIVQPERWSLEPHSSSPLQEGGRMQQYIPVGLQRTGAVPPRSMVNEEAESEIPAVPLSAAPPKQ